jgi:hypothetical protein
VDVHTAASRAVTRPGLAGRARRICQCLLLSLGGASAAGKAEPVVVVQLDTEPGNITPALDPERSPAAASYFLATANQLE